MEIMFVTRFEQANGLEKAVYKYTHYYCLGIVYMCKSAYVSLFWISKAYLKSISSTQISKRLASEDHTVAVNPEVLLDGSIGSCHAEDHLIEWWLKSCSDNQNTKTKMAVSNK